MIIANFCDHGKPGADLLRQNFLFGGQVLHGGQTLRMWFIILFHGLQHVDKLLIIRVFRSLKP